MSTDATRWAPETSDDVAWLSPDQQRDWRALIALVMTLPASLDAQLKRDAGVNMFEYHVLARLADAPERTLVLSDLAALAQGSLSRLSHAITRLERDGWVQRHACSEGPRRIEASLTDAGSAKLRTIAPGHVREARRLVIDVLTPEQLHSVGEAARAITTRTLASRAPDETTG